MGSVQPGDAAGLSQVDTVHCGARKAASVQLRQEQPGARCHSQVAVLAASQQSRGEPGPCRAHGRLAVEPVVVRAVGLDRVECARAVASSRDENPAVGQQQGYSRLSLRDHRARSKKEGLERGIVRLGRVERCSIPIRPPGKEHLSGGQKHGRMFASGYVHPPARRERPGCVVVDFGAVQIVAVKSSDDQHPAIRKQSGRVKRPRYPHASGRSEAPRCRVV